jgi:hypothetical protein
MPVVQARSLPVLHLPGLRQIPASGANKAGFVRRERQKDMTDDE